MLSISLAPHPLLDAQAFVSRFPSPLSGMGTSPRISALLAPGAGAPLQADDGTRAAVRDLLRHGGFKPTGRSKPASEYLVRAIQEGALSSINLAVDACNVVSFHSGLPISVVDLDRAREPLSVGIAAAGSAYVFNASGQVIDIGGLVCLMDADGPCAGAVKDSQRTKTHGGTTRTLSLIWGPRALGGRAEAASRWYRSLLEAEGVSTEEIGWLQG